MKPHGAPRILFQSRNRRGLGHLMRGLNIARAIRSLEPTAQILFYTRNSAAQALCDGFDSIAAPEEADEADWHRAVAAFGADVEIYDTMLPASTQGRNAVFVMRACKAEEQTRVLGSAVLREMAEIIVPHTRVEFGFELPRAIAARAQFVGPIIREPHPALQAQLRARYGITANDLVVVSTVGGGGFAEQARQFFDVVTRAHPLLRARISHLKHIVVRGPLFTSTLTPQAGMTIVDVEPELGTLISQASVVIAEGGYNTVNEIRLAKTPAIFLPSDRKLDDQAVRVLDMANRGLAAVLATALPGIAASGIADICASPERLAAMRQAYANDHMSTGNAHAARIILDSARRSRT